MNVLNVFPRVCSHQAGCSCQRLVRQLEVNPSGHTHKSILFANSTVLVIARTFLPLYTYQSAGATRIVMYPRCQWVKRGRRTATLVRCQIGCSPWNHPLIRGPKLHEWVPRNLSGQRATMTHSSYRTREAEVSSCRKLPASCCMEEEKAATQTQWIQT
jgi:hypothetical protein